MTTLMATATLGIYLLFGSVSDLRTSSLSSEKSQAFDVKTEEVSHSIDLHRTKEMISEPSKTFAYSIPKQVNKSTQSNNVENTNGQISKTQIERITESRNQTEAKQGASETQNSILPTDTPPIVSAKKVKKTLVREVWVEPVYETYRIPHEGDIDDFWMGIHYTQEATNYTDSNKTHGFNLQFMSGNLIKNAPFAFYGGLDWGMQFSGKSDRQEVILNTINEDIGYTYLSSLSNDILLRGHLEFPNYRIVPYATFFAGPRIYSTGQTVGMHNPPIDIEATSRENVRNSALLAMGGGIGARIKLTDYASLDLRYEQIFGETKSIVDLEVSRLVGTAYDLSFKGHATDFGQFKLGIVFDLSSSKHDRKIIQEGYTKEVTETYYIDPDDADKIIIPSKPCPQNSSSNNTRYEGENNSNGGWIPSGNSGNGSSGGGGKSSTPSIKSPVIRH